MGRPSEGGGRRGGDVVEFQDVTGAPAEQAGQRLRRRPALAAQRPQHARQHRVRLRARLAAVARRHLPRDHRRPDLALGEVVRRVHPLMVQERQHALAVLAQQPRQPRVVRVGVVAREQPPPLRMQPAPEHRISMRTDRPAAALQSHRRTE